jgi:predicted nucleic acid-binding protein
MFLLDTNVISELRRLDRAAEQVERWASSQDSVRLFLSCMTVFEVQLGALRARRRDPRKAEVLQTWLDGVVSSYHGRILGIDTEIALLCAALHVPDPRSERDAYIAATALVHDLVVITRNTRDFAGTGVRLFNPWES